MGLRHGESALDASLHGIEFVQAARHAGPAGAVPSTDPDLINAPAQERSITLRRAPTPHQQYEREADQIAHDGEYAHQLQKREDELRDRTIVVQVAPGQDSIDKLDAQESGVAELQAGVEAQSTQGEAGLGRGEMMKWDETRHNEVLRDQQQRRIDDAAQSMPPPARPVPSSALGPEVQAERQSGSQPSRAGTAPQQLQGGPSPAGGNIGLPSTTQTEIPTYQQPLALGSFSIFGSLASDRATGLTRRQQDANTVNEAVFSVQNARRVMRAYRGTEPYVPFTTEEDLDLMVRTMQKFVRDMRD